MASEITVPGPISGTPYRFRISGDRPSVDEQRRIDASISRQEQEFQTRYAAAFGAPLDTGEGSGFGNQVGEFFKGIGSGIVGLLESGALGAATLLPEERELGAREGIRRAGYWASQPFRPDIGLEDSLAGQFGQGLGSFVGLLGTAAIPGVGLPAATALAVGSGAAEASERARAAGATEDERNRAIRYGAVVGASEMLPVERVRSLVSAIGRPATLAIRQRIMRALGSAGVEGAQEAAATIAQNLIEQGIYNPERGTLESTGESFGIGAGVGGLVQALLDLSIPRSRGRGPSPTPGTGNDDAGAVPSPTSPTSETTGAAAPPSGAPTSETTDGAPTSETTDAAAPPSGAPASEATGAATPPSGAPTSEATGGAPTSEATGGVAARGPDDILAEATESTVEEVERLADDFGLTPANVVDIADRAKSPEGALAAEQEFGLGPGDAASMRAEVLRTPRGDTPAQVAAKISSWFVPEGAIDTSTASPAEFAITAEALRDAGVGVKSSLYRGVKAGTLQGPDLRAAMEMYIGRQATRRPAVADALKALLPPESDAGGRGKGVPSDPVGEGVRPDTEGRASGSSDSGRASAPDRGGVDGAGGASDATSPRPESGDAPLTPTLRPPTPSMAYNAVGVGSATQGQQVIPPGVPPAPYTPPSPDRAPRLSPEEALVAELRGEIREPPIVQEEVAVSQAVLDGWVDANAPPAVKRHLKEMGSAVDTTTTREDRNTVVRLLVATRGLGRGRARTAETAARAYFSTNPNVAQVVEEIAADFVEATIDGAGYRKGADPYYVGKGGKAAQLAAEWIKANLSERTMRYFDDMVAKYDGDYNESAYKALSKLVDKKIRLERAEAAQKAAYEEMATEAALREARRQFVSVFKGNFMKLELQAPAALLQMPLHPTVVRSLRAGNLPAALTALSSTTRSPRISALAQKLASRMGSVRSIVVSRENMNTVGRILDPDYDWAGKRQRPGAVYVPKVSEQDVRREFPEEQVPVVLEMMDSIVFSEDTALTPHALLHEALHVTLTDRLNDGRNPTTKKLEELRAKVEAITGPTLQVEDVHEFASEAMTNPAFQRLLNQINIDGTRETAWDRFVRHVTNFARRILSLPAREGQPKIGDRVDRLVYEMLNAPVPYAAHGSQDLSDVSFMRQEASGNAINRIAGRMMPSAAMYGDMRNMLARSDVPDKLKGFVLRAAVPLLNVADMATPYIPNAKAIHRLVERHAAKVHADSRRVRATTGRIGNYLKANPDKIDTFNDLRLLASLYQIDPRKPDSYYKGHRLTYDVLDANGRPKRRVVESYPTRADRLARVLQLNEKGKRPATRSLAKNLKKFTKEDEANLSRVRQLYRELGSEGQSAYADALSVFEYFHARTADVLRARINAMFPDPKDRSRRDEIYDEIYAKVFSDNVIVPYQPLQRQGKFWVSFRVLTDASDSEGKLHKVSFETRAQQQDAIRELRAIDARGEHLIPEEAIEAYEGRDDARERAPVPAAFAADVLRTIDAAGKLDDNLRQQIVDLVFDAAPESSFIQSYRRRKGTAGFEGDPDSPLNRRLSRQDTISLLQRKGYSVSRQLADMEVSQQLAEEVNAIDAHMAALQRDVSDEGLRTARRARVYADVLKDYTTAIRRQRSAISRNVTSGTYALTLGLNVSTAVLTFAQFPTIIVPYLGGKYGYRKTTRALGNASRILRGSGGTRMEERIAPGGEVVSEQIDINRFDYSLTNYNFDEVTDPKLLLMKELSDEMKLRGLDNRSITEDVLDFSNADNKFQSVVSWSGILQHHAERFTRETTAIAAYELQLEQMAKEQNTTVSELSAADRQAAASDALYTAELTNGTIQATAAPLFAQGDVGSVIYLFKRFGLHMFNMLYNTMMRSLPSNASPEDRRIARMQFAGVMGAVALFSGAQGMPLFQSFAMLWDMFLTDDDDEDFRTLARIGLGELGYSGIINYVTGTSVASRIGLSGMFYREPFNADDQPWLFTQAEAIGGPAVGLAIRYTDRIPALLEQGDYWRAAESFLPSAIANPLRAIRTSTEGVETLRGDPIIGDIGPYNGLMQFFGFAPAEYIRQLEQNTALTRIDRAILSRRVDLLRRRYRAVAEGDRVGYREVMREIREYNADHPQHAISAATLRNSLRSHFDTTSRMHHGVLFNARNEALLRRMAEQWGPASMWSE